MKRQRLFVRQGLALVLLAATFALAGCQGFLAERKIKSIEDKLNSIRNYNPDKHAKSEWESSNNQLTEIKAVKPTDPSGANTRAEQLLPVVDTLVTTVEVAQAADLAAQAEEARQVMDKNEGRGIAPDQYDAILATLNTARERQGAQSYRDAVEGFNDVITRIENLLLPVKQKADRKLNDLKQERRKMDTFECPKFAPEFITEVEKIIADVDDLIAARRDYLTAETTASKGMLRAQEGITKASRLRARLEISRLEQRLSKAQEEGAEIYCSGDLNQAQSTYDSIVRAFFQDKFDEVLSNIELLRPRVDALIFCTLESSTRDKLQKLNASIQYHIDGGVPEYLPGRVERLAEKVEAAQEDFDVTAQDPGGFPDRSDAEKAEIEKSFDKIKRDLQEAFLLSDRINKAFDDLAGTALRDAEYELNIAQELFDKMEGAFLAPTPADLTPLDPSFSNNKGSLQGELQQRLLNQQYSLSEAKIQRDQSEYRKAIESSREIESRAQAIQGQVYRVVAENALTELENQITRFTREGAAELASADLSLTRSLLDQAKTMMAAGQYKDAVQQSSRVRAQLDVTLQVLGRSVLEKADAARLAIDSSEELRASQFAPETVGRARALLDQSQSELSAKNYRSALQMAEQAAQTARDARVEAGLAWSRNELDMAREQRLLAEASEAIAYAPLLVRRGQNQYASAHDLRDAPNPDYAAAALAAQEAAKSFRDATYRRVDEANDAILAARRSEGWKYEKRELTKAMVKAEQASEAMKAASETARSDAKSAGPIFRESRSLAEQARTIADEVRVASQRSGVNERLARIQKSLSETIKTGANYFQVSEVRRLLSETEALKASLGNRTYEDAVEELNRIDAEFENVLNSTPARVRQVVAQLTAKLDKMEEDDAAAVIAPDETREARRRLNYVTIDFDEGNFSRAYGNLEAAIKGVNAVEARVAERAYQIEITKTFRELNESLVRFDPVVKLGPDVMRRMSRGLTGRGQAVALSNAMSPTEFKEVVDDIYLKVTAIEPPPTRENLHKQVVRAVTEARLAAAEFQKILIFDELDQKTINATIDAAYKHHANMVRVRSEVQQRLLDTGADLDVVPTEQVRPYARLVSPGI